MQKVATVGLDLAKSVFQIHAIDCDGLIVTRRALRRSQVLEFFRKLSPCVVGLGAVRLCVGIDFRAISRVTKLPDHAARSII